MPYQRVVTPLLLLGLLASQDAWPAGLGASADSSHVILNLANSKVRATITIDGGHLSGERLESLPAWADSLGPGGAVETDGDFLLEVVWTGWQAPGQANNADNLCYFTAADFRLAGQERPRASGMEELVLSFEGPEGLGLKIDYQLPATGFFLRRRLTVFDPRARNHFLQAVWPIRAGVRGSPAVVKDGGFGQPIALTEKGGGAFLGLEWPAATNRLMRTGTGLRVNCGEEMGELISKTGVTSEPAVLAVTPDDHVKRWFFDYLGAIRAGTLRPYTLYDTWHDLRPTEYAGIEPRHMMNEGSVLRNARLLREKLVERHGVRLDAFVLDDGWSAVESGWDLRSEEFPHGLGAIQSELRKTATTLGIWYGPTGGYRLREKRIEWMKRHGYECAGDQLWVGGPKYSALLEARTTGMAREGVDYFKWDGFQFVASDSGLGTPPGIYSRRAALKRVVHLAEEVRKANPAAFLTLSSGTWPSPWWLQIADQIWMGGEDYAGAAVQAITLRDAIMSYRDQILYWDLREQDFWLPMTNLMTHGILKATVGVGDTVWNESPSKFGDEAVFFLARGVSLQELYLEPELVSDEEWRVLADALRWARDRFALLAHTEMVGGDPGKGEAYGYAHFAGRRGILAARNPGIAPSSLRVPLDASLGLDPKTTRLVLERVHPTRWVAPRLYGVGDTLELPLLGGEVAVYELQPLSEVRGPLLAGAVFEEEQGEDGLRRLAVLSAEAGATLLNADLARGLRIDGEPSSGPLRLPAIARPALVGDAKVEARGSGLVASFDLGARARRATLGALLERDRPMPGAEDPKVVARLDGVEMEVDTVAVKGVWAWNTIRVPPGRHAVTIEVAGRGGARWVGSAQVWITADEKVDPVYVEMASDVKPAPARPLPSSGRGPHELPCVVNLGKVKIEAAPR